MIVGELWACEDCNQPYSHPNEGGLVGMTHNCGGITSDKGGIYRKVSDITKKDGKFYLITREGDEEQTKWPL